MNKLFFFFLTITSISFVNAQSSSVSVVDGVFIRENNFNKVPIQHNYEIESYMMWSKRVWRVIDLKEKMKPLITAELQAYNILEQKRSKL